MPAAPDQAVRVTATPHPHRGTVPSLRPALKDARDPAPPAAMPRTYNLIRPHQSVGQRTLTQSLDTGILSPTPSSWLMGPERVQMFDCLRDTRVRLSTSRRTEADGGAPQYVLAPPALPRVPAVDKSRITRSGPSIGICYSAGGIAILFLRESSPIFDAIDLS